MTSLDTSSAPYVADSSSLIVLAKIGRLDLLNIGDHVVLVTETVFQEVTAGDADDPARSALLSGFGQRTPDVPIPPALANWELDAGEEATLALTQYQTQQGRPMKAVLDDGDGRRAARAMKIAYTGTVGLVIIGKRRALVSSAADTLRDLKAAGLFLPPDRTLIDELESLGETWP